jgi:hypothetical protein
MPPEGFEPTIPASERPQAHALDGAATEAERNTIIKHNFNIMVYIKRV